MIRVKNLSVLLAACLSMTAITGGAAHRTRVPKPAEKPREPPLLPPAQGRISVTDHIIKLGARRFPTGDCATILLKERKGRTNRAGLLHRLHAQRREDLSQRRPSRSFYNGGPGSSSVWLHMGSFSAAPGDHRECRCDAPAPTSFPRIRTASWTKRIWSSLTPWERASATPWARRRTGFLGCRSRRQITGRNSSHLRQPQQPLISEISHGESYGTFRSRRFRTTCSPMMACTSTASC